VYAEIIGNLLQGENPGEIRSRHCLAPVGIVPGECPEWLGKRTALCAWYLAQTLHRSRFYAVAVDKSLVTKEHLVM
jgi:hypothetical protein